ncbi:MAG: hypothetical protein ACE5NG_21105 [bacterium]
MEVPTKKVTIQQILELVKNFSLVDQCTLVASLNRQIDKSFPEQATVDEAIALYLADK